jgi:7-cyano-7-deazaguanine reductase
MHDDLQPAATSTPDAAQDAADLRERALRHTEQALGYMARFGVRPSGEVRPFLPPSERRQTIDRLPYEHAARQRVTYQTERGEFSALCPFSGLPDYGTVTIEYVPGSWILELKSLKYYLMSWREVGAAQEDVTALVYADLAKHLGDARRLSVTTVYNVRGGINTTCVVDSLEQGDQEQRGA